MADELLAAMLHDKIRDYGVDYSTMMSVLYGALDILSSVEKVLYSWIEHCEKI